VPEISDADLLRLNWAIRVAAEAHDDQRDKQGKPYFLHPLEVMLRCECLGYVGMAAAVLHDVLEDCGASWVGVIRRAAGEDVLRIVQLLTKLPGELYPDYIKRVCTDIIAVRIKLADIAHNSSRLYALTLEEQHRLMAKYNFARGILHDASQKYEQEQANAESTKSADHQAGSSSGQGS